MKIANNGRKLLTERGKTRLKNHKKMYKRFNYDNGEIMTVYKNTKEGIIAVYEDSSISIYTFSWEKLPEKEGYQNTTKKVFDKIYNETLNKIQNLNK